MSEADLANPVVAILPLILVGVLNKVFTSAIPAVFGSEFTVPLPGHPVTTLLFIGICATVSVSSFVQDPLHSLIGLALTVAGFPVYLLWRRTR